MNNFYKVSITVLQLLVGVGAGFLVIKWFMGYDIGMNIVVSAFLAFLGLFLGIKGLLGLIREKKIK